MPLTLDIQVIWKAITASKNRKRAAVLLLVLVFRRLHSYFTRWRLHRQIETYYSGRYALTKEDEAKGLPRMNKCGYRGVHDAQTLLRQIQFKEMPLLYHKSLEFALFRTYAIPSISKILLRTGNLVANDKYTRRFMDTVLLITSFGFYPLPRLDSKDEEAGMSVKQQSSNKTEPPWLHDEDFMFEKEDPRSAIALARTNWLHRRANKIHGPQGAPISNDDLLYTMSVFVTQPIVWLQRFGWRPMSPLEQEATFTVWEHIGKCMGIEGIPDSLQGLWDWAEEYEKREMVYSDQNETVAIETVNLLFFYLPVRMRKPFFPFVTSVMDERLRLAVGFPPASRLISWIPQVGGLTFAYWLRWFGLPRKDYGVRVPYYGDEGTNLMGAMCPVTGKQAELGGTCPAHGKVHEAKARMIPKWTNNDPHYMAELPLTSLQGIYERLFVSPEKRSGAKHWQSLRKKDKEGEAEESKHGYRLEECGPKGLEQVGHDDIRKEATQLMGKDSLTGPWAF